MNSRALSGLPSPARLVALGLRALVLAWRYGFTIFFPPACRFAPTCSDYAAQALERHGPVRGSWLALRRIARCHPWGGSGFDPVPEVRPGHDPDHPARPAGSGGPCPCHEASCRNNAT